MHNEDAEVVDVPDAAGWRKWLSEHHRDDRGVWLVVNRRSSPGGLGYEDAICEALCFGWVDSTARTLPDGRPTIWFTQRRPGSGWSAPNKARVTRLIQCDALAPPGLAAIQAAQADGSWSLYDSAEALIEPPELASALDAVPEARAAWDAFPPGVRKNALAWIAVAKRPQTRAQRIARIVSRAELGQRPG